MNRGDSRSFHPSFSDNAHVSGSLGDLERTDGGIRAATGVSKNGKAGEGKVVRERDHICGPIADPAARLKIRAAEARPIRNDNADCKLPRQWLTTKQMPFESVAGRAVEIEDWSYAPCSS
jgi:hypothetical protein